MRALASATRASYSGLATAEKLTPSGGCGAGHERHRQARHVEVEGGEEHVPCPGLEGDRVELGLVDTLQLHVDAELLPCRHGQFHRQRRVLDLDDVEGADRQWCTVLLAHSVRAHRPAGLVEQLPGRFEVGTGREERADRVARAGLGQRYGEPSGQRTVASRLHAHQLLQVETTHQRLAHGDVGRRQTLHLVEEELTDDGLVLRDEVALVLDALAISPGHSGDVDLTGQQQVGCRRLVGDDPHDDLGRKAGQLARGAVGPPGVVVPGAERVVVVGDRFFEDERTGAVRPGGEHAAIGEALQRTR